MKAVLSLRNIYKYYYNNEKPLKVLHNACFDLHKGEMIALVAPSGCGKSTLLHIAALLEQPNSGDVCIFGNKCSNLSNAERTKIRRNYVGFIYQSHHLLPEFSALENVMMPQLIAGKSSKLSRHRANRLLQYMQIGGKLNNRPSELSGGQQQRVAIARAVANAPSLLFADEPTGNLDPQTSLYVFSFIKKLVKEANIAALIATHNYELAKKMDRIINIKDGKIVEL